jgi:hypothetical protein
MNYRCTKRVNFVLVPRASKSVAAVHVGHIVDKMTLGQKYLKDSQIPSQSFPLPSVCLKVTTHQLAQYHKLILSCGSI